MPDPADLLLVLVQLFVVAFLKAQISALHICQDGISQVRGKVYASEVGDETGEHTRIDGEIGGRRKAEQADDRGKRRKADDDQQHPGTSVKHPAGSCETFPHETVKEIPENYRKETGQSREKAVEKSHIVREEKENSRSDTVVQEVKGSDDRIEEHDNAQLDEPLSLEKGQDCGKKQ